MLKWMLLIGVFPLSTLALNLNLTESQARSACDVIANRDLGVKASDCDKVKSYEDLINLNLEPLEVCGLDGKRPTTIAEKKCVERNEHIQRRNESSREKRRLIVIGYAAGIKANCAIVGEPTQGPSGLQQGNAEAVKEGG